LVASFLSQWVVGTEEVSLGQIEVMGMAGHGLMVSEPKEKDLDDVGALHSVLAVGLWVWCHGFASCDCVHALAR